LTSECQQLLRSLERATARLADLRPQDAVEVQQAVEERERAIAAIVGWIAAEHEASRPVSPELANHLTRDLELGAGILVRMAIDRETTRLDLAKLGRELQMLRGLNNSSTAKPSTIDYQG
jgi:hypothetical protein